MRLKLTASSVIIFASLLAGCSTEPQPSAADGSSEVSTTQAESPAVAPPQVKAKMGSDSSEIVTTRDETGAYIETRTFLDNKHLGSIVIKTLGDGTKIGSAFGKDGQKLPLADNHIALALGSTGDELAEMVGILKPSQEPQAQPAFVATSPTLVESVPALRTEDPAEIVRIASQGVRDLEQQRETVQKAQAEKLRKMQKDLNRMEFGKPVDQ